MTFPECIKTFLFCNQPKCLYHRMILAWRMCLYRLNLQLKKMITQHLIFVMMFSSITSLKNNYWMSTVTIHKCCQYSKAFLHTKQNISNHLSYLESNLDHIQRLAYKPRQASAGCPSNGVMVTWFWGGINHCQGFSGTFARWTWKTLDAPQKANSTQSIQSAVTIN